MQLNIRNIINIFVEAFKNYPFFDIVKDDLTTEESSVVQIEGNRNIKRKINYYNLDDEIWTIHLR